MGLNGPDPSCLGPPFPPLPVAQDTISAQPRCHQPLPQWWELQTSNQHGLFGDSYHRGTRYKPKWQPLRMVKYYLCQATGNGKTHSHIQSVCPSVFILIILIMTCHVMGWFFGQLSRASKKIWYPSLCLKKHPKHCSVVRAGVSCPKTLGSAAPPTTHVPAAAQSSHNHRTSRSQESTMLAENHSSETTKMCSKSSLWNKSAIEDDR